MSPPRDRDTVTVSRRELREFLAEVTRALDAMDELARHRPQLGLLENKLRKLVGDSLTPEEPVKLSDLEYANTVRPPPKKR